MSVPQKPGYAELQCKGKAVYDKKGKVKYYPHKGGQLVGPPVYGDDYKNASLCVRMLVDEHEKEHLDDPDLNEACARKKMAKAHNKKIKAANMAWQAQLKKSECSAYESDLDCFKKLAECCKRRKGRKTKTKTGESILCCNCEDVEKAKKVTEKMQRKRECKKK